MKKKDNHWGPSILKLTKKYHKTQENLNRLRNKDFESLLKHYKGGHYKMIHKIKRRVRARVKKLPPEQVVLILQEHTEIKRLLPGVGNETIVKLLTGGYWSQSLDTFVMKELAEQAGWIIDYAMASAQSGLEEEK